MDKQVIVYSSTGCPRCLQVKEQLKAWGVPFEERNVSESEAYFTQLRERKIFGTPATFIGNKPILGFQPEKLRAALGLDAAADQPAESGTAKAAGAAAAAPDRPETSPSGVREDIFTGMTEAHTRELYDLVCIGGGPAGASAALYASRARLKTLVIDKAPAAGTLALTHKIANYPGIRGEMTGRELLKEMQLQAKDFGAQLVRTQVLSVDFSDPDVKRLETPEGAIRTKTVFIGVGAKAPSSKIIGEEDYAGRGVSYCSTCDAAFFENRTVAVAGDSEEAVHEAIVLAKFCKDVYLFVPTAQLKGDGDLSELSAHPNIRIFMKHRLKEISGADSVERVTVLDEQRQERAYAVDGVFLYLAGMKPGTDFLGGAVARDGEGYVDVDANMRTSVEGVFAGGDARRTPVKQAVISASDGCIAALGAESFLNKRSRMLPQYS